MSIVIEFIRTSGTLYGRNERHNMEMLTVGRFKFRGKTSLEERITFTATLTGINNKLKSIPCI